MYPTKFTILRFQKCLVSVALGIGSSWGLQLTSVGQEVISAKQFGPSNVASEQLRGEETPQPGTNYALLIGVTHYPGLSNSNQLEGPANDVLLMSDLLREVYEFSADNIVILSEKEGEKDPSRLPTRENIKRECERLARDAKKSDKVVVSMSGHGSRQPEHPNHPNPSGLDKTFLPRDIDKWDKEIEQTQNAIPGWELGDWLRPIPGKGASLWIVVDACHSGAMIRGASETVRQVDASRELSIPEEALEKARQRARERIPSVLEKTRGSGIDEAPVRLGHEVGVAVTYACQSSEVTVELPLPQQSTESKPHGLLTYSLNQILRSSSGKVTYQDVIHKIQSNYDAMGRRFPTPSVEGKAKDQIVLGREKPSRSPVIVSKKGNSLQINAGKLHGLRVGNLMLVKSDDGSLLGQVQITNPIRATSAQVEPRSQQGHPLPKPEMLIGGRAEVERIDYGDLKLKVALSPTEANGKPVPVSDQQKLTQILTEVAKNGDSPIIFLQDMKDADWIIRLDSDQIVLVRASEMVGTQPPLLLAKHDSAENVLATLKTQLGQIVRAEMLVRMANALEVSPGLNDTRVLIKTTLQRKGKTDGDWQPTEGPIAHLYAGDEVTIELANLSRSRVDVTVLYIDSNYGIEVLFPEAGEDNRLNPGEKPLVLPSLHVTGDTTGREQIIVIAVKGEKEPADFSVFAQPTLLKANEESKKESTRGERSSALDSPLGQLLSSALYTPSEKQATTRSGLSKREIDNYTMKAIPVQIEISE